MLAMRAYEKHKATKERRREKGWRTGTETEREEDETGMPRPKGNRVTWNRDRVNRTGMRNGQSDDEKESENGYEREREGDLRQWTCPRCWALNCCEESSI